MSDQFVSEEGRRSLVGLERPHVSRRPIGRSRALLLGTMFIVGVINAAVSRAGTRIVDETVVALERLASIVAASIHAVRAPAPELADNGLCAAAAYAHAGAPRDLEKSLALFNRHRDLLSPEQSDRLDAKLLQRLDSFVASSDTDGAIRSYEALFADALTRCRAADASRDHEGDRS